jgi:hypothetical protein
MRNWIANIRSNIFKKISRSRSRLIKYNDIDYFPKPRPYFDIEAQVKVVHKRFIHPAPFWAYYSYNDSPVFDDDDEYDYDYEPIDFHM